MHTHTTVPPRHSIGFHGNHQQQTASGKNHFHFSNMPTIVDIEIKRCLHVYFIVSMTTVNKNTLRQKEAYRDGIKRKGDKIGMVSMCGMSSNVKVVAT